MDKLIKLFALITCGCLFISCNNNQMKTGKIDYKSAEQYIRESEKQWAESVASDDSIIILNILADDFIGIDPEGNQYNKQQMLLFAHNSQKEFKSNHLTDVKIRFYDSTAIAQGDETWVRYSGQQLTGRFVWTDTWILRDGKWQIVAAEDLIAPVK